MLTSLKISNYALIDQLAMQPSGGLSMITGETGAGKSIMLGAVGLLLGNRADTKVLLHEDKKCVVEGIFDIRSYGLQEYFEELELDYEDTCIIRREISPNGKSRSFVNDTPVLLEPLKILGEKLMDVHSQHDTLLLGEGDFQLGLVDAYAQTSAERTDFQQAYTEFKTAKKALVELTRQAEALKKEYDFNQFQLDELSNLTLVSGEQEELESSQEILENAEDIKLKINEVLSLFHEEQFGLLHGMAQIQSSLQGLERLAQAFGTYRARFQEAWIELKDLTESLADEDSRVEVDAEKLERTRERLSKIYQLQKKHGLQTVDQLIALESQLADKVFQVQQIDDQLADAHQLCLRNEKVMLAAGEALSQKRRACFPAFEKALEALLQDLGMENARVQFEGQLVEPNGSGIDRVELLFSANKGMPLQPLKKVASGGEFSRLLFAIKYLMADKMALPTLIFDEIDSGISGEVALQMVRMMQEIAKNHQVICITHLPQVAAKGEVHFFVFKDHSAEKTISKVKQLTAEERIHELAKMIAGANPSVAAQASAKELLMN
ncbi:MAG: DNA repair protein RecN [Algoriphagus sp.]|nr:DNA repair protein RecN [Algoriphagus sp.]MCE2778045.1 DNA repair protein RecN [Algoriphagus sp.]